MDKWRLEHKELYRSITNACRNKWNKENPEKVKAQKVRGNLRYLHGKKAVEIFVYLSGVQGGVCAICGGQSENERLAIDHCHKTGVIRGLLCTRCNTGLGSFKDNTSLLLNAIRYLETKERAITSLSSSTKKEELNG